MKAVLADILHDAGNRIEPGADGRHRCRRHLAGERDVELALLRRIEKIEDKLETRDMMREQNRRDFPLEETRRQLLEYRVRSVEQAVRDLQLQERLRKLQAIYHNKEKPSDCSRDNHNMIDRQRTLDTMQCVKHELLLHPVTRPGAEITSDVAEDAICRVPFFQLLDLGKDYIRRALTELVDDGLLTVWSSDDDPSSRAPKRRRTVKGYKKVSPCVLRIDHRVEAARIALGVPLSCFF
jgi:hypothetical protein